MTDEQVQASPSLPDEQAPKSSSVWPLVAALVLVTLAVYWQSFQGAFVFDDPGSLIDNPSIQHLWPITGPLNPPRGQGITVEGRPVLNLTLAVNWAIDQYNSTYSYHVGNFIIHMLAALALFGLVRRTLLLERWGGRFGSCAGELALAVAAIWAIHPLQTESVTYIVQRAESLMGLFYLATLYFALRAFTDKHGWAWSAAAICTCALGMGSKEVMVSAPLAVILFDRFFLFGSFKEAIARRWKLYAGLAVTWAILVYEVSQSATRGGTAGFTGNISAWAYFQTQMVFIARYLGLAFWPFPPNHLVLDYGINLITGLQRVWPYALLMAGLLAATLAAIRYRPWAGYLAILFWMLLAPTSSFVPNVNQVAAEHRMYLPLAPLVALVVVGLFVLYQRWASGRSASEDGRWVLDRALPAGTLLVVLAALGYRTWIRNGDYGREAVLWSQIVWYYPDNPRGYLNVAYMLSNGAGQLEKMALQEPDKEKAQALKRRSVQAYTSAVAKCTEAIEHSPEYAMAWSDRGTHWGRLGKKEDAIRDFTKAIALDPRLVQAYSGRGAVYRAMGRKAEAMKDFDTALQYRPKNEFARLNRIGLLLEEGYLTQAHGECAELVQLFPDDAGALRYMGDILRAEGKPQEGLTYVDKSLQITPESGPAYAVRASILADLKRLPEARQDLAQAYRLGEAAHPDIEDKLHLPARTTGRN